MEIRGETVVGAEEGSATVVLPAYPGCPLGHGRRTAVSERFDAFHDLVLSYLAEHWRSEDPDTTAVASRFVRTTEGARRAAVVRDIDGLLGAATRRGCVA